MKKIGSILCFLLFSLTLINVPCAMKNMAFASEKELCSHAKSALLYDKNSQTIIFEKDASLRLPIASMTKLGSLMLIFDAIEKGNLSEETKVKISHHASETEGSSAFLDENSEYRVGDLIMTVIVCSANDSTVALAEAVSGSEEEFVKKLNSKIKKLGLSDTSFVNATGLPAIDHYSTAKDILKIYEQICDNEIYKKYSKIWMTELVHPSGRKTDIVNTNRLIKTFEGCDGGKTGFTNDAGFCLSASATRSNMRLIGVVIGEKESKTRFNEMAEMFNYGFANFENKVVLTSDQPILEAEVLAAKQKTIKVYPEKDYVKFLKKGEEFKYNLDYRLNKIKAPLKAGDEVGKLYILDDKNIVIEEMPLVVKENVERIKYKEILIKIFKKI